MTNRDDQRNRDADTIDGAATPDASQSAPRVDREAATIDGASAGAAGDTNRTVDRDAPTLDGTAPPSPSAATDPADPDATVVSSHVGAAETIAGEAIPAAMPERIAGYKLIRPIASGGMGTVFLAEQEHPQRLVALKVMKQGLASRSALRRFEYESEILGRLRHPGIAQVYEAGMHDDGSGGVPYFAMEYVADARILTDYVTTNRLNESECLELFVDICDAVHHGHQKGIVHRDLKPANILVDLTGQVKVIDFGVARTTDADRTDTLQTQVGQLVGTVQYMSPEQIEADPNDIDTRSDVYALGLCLYEMLSGRLPYDLEALPLHEATRIIQHVEPRRLSTFAPEVRGDIETIVLHALEKERDRRYQSAHDFAADIRRYLKYEPIVARPPSTWYITTRFVRRNRVVVGFVTALFLALIGGIFGISAALIKAENEREIAVANWTRAEIAQGIWDHAMEQVTAREGGTNNARIVDLLDVIDVEIDTTVQDQPDVEAHIRRSIGNAYKSVGEYVRAARQLRAALRIRRELTPEPTAALALLMRDLGSVLWFNGEFARAEPLFRESLEVLRSLDGDEASDEETANALNYLAACLNSQQDYPRAEELYREALDMRMAILLNASEAATRADAREKIARSKNNLATSLMSQGKYEQAQMYLADAIDIVAELRGGRDHIDVARGLSNLGRCMAALGKTGEARDAFIESLKTKRAQLQPGHSSIAATLHYLAELSYREAQYADAENEAREALAIRQGAFRPGHRRTCESAELLAKAIEAQGRWEDAHVGWLDTVACLEAQNPQRSSSIELTRQHAASMLIELDRAPEAEPVMLAAHEAIVAAQDSVAADIRTSCDSMIRLYEALDQPEQVARYQQMRDALAADGDSDP